MSADTVSLLPPTVSCRPKFAKLRDTLSPQIIYKHTTQTVCETQKECFLRLNSLLRKRTSQRICDGAAALFSQSAYYEAFVQ